MNQPPYYKSINHKVSLSRNVFPAFANIANIKAEDLVDILHEKFIVDDFAYHDDMYYWPVYDYFKDTVIPHKIAVYHAGMDLCAHKNFEDILRSGDREQFQWNLIVHDLSKFSANEAFGYAGYNFKNPSAKSKPAFEAAWHHHKMNNPHHPEYWLNPNRSGELEPIAMPDIYILEMIADWVGAGKVYGSTIEEWLPKNISKFKFPNTERVHKLITMFTGISIQ